MICLLYGPIFIIISDLLFLIQPQTKNRKIFGVEKLPKTTHFVAIWLKSVSFLILILQKNLNYEKLRLRVESVLYFFFCSAFIVFTKRSRCCQLATPRPPRHATAPVTPDATPRVAGPCLAVDRLAPASSIDKIGRYSQIRK